MYCTKCGKEISDQAKFCNYCGTPVETAQPKSAPAPKAAPAKKKGKSGSTIRTILIALVVYFAVSFVTENVLTGKKDPSPDVSTSVSQTQNPVIELETPAEDPKVTSAMGSCFYGALYQNDYLRYGMTRLYAPGYSLLPGEGDERDWLISSDSGCLITVYKSLEILDISYEESTSEVLLESFHQSYSDLSMVDFQKLYVNGFPVIRYIVGYTADDLYQYAGELIVFPDEMADQTIRLMMIVDGTSGFGVDDINQIFDTLEVSPDFKVNSEDTGVMGLNRITVK